MFDPVALMILIVLCVAYAVLRVSNVWGDRIARRMDEGPSDRIPLTAGDRVAPGVLCTECGYELRDLPVGGACPECGTEIAIALREGWHVETRRRRAIVTVMLILAALCVLGLLTLSG